MYGHNIAVCIKLAKSVSCQGEKTPQNSIIRQVTSDMNAHNPNQKEALSINPNNDKTSDLNKAQRGRFKNYKNVHGQYPK